MDVLEQTLFGNTYQAWLIAVGAGLLVVVVLRTLQSLTRRRLGKLAARTATRWDDYVVEMISGTKLLFWLVAGVLVGSLLLEIPGRVQSGITVAFVIALLIQAGIWGGLLINSAVDDYRKKTLEESPADVTTLSLIGLAGQTAVWSLVVLLILDNLGVDITALVAGLGIGGVAVALALQNILGDLFASLSIVLDKPFVVGDFLMVGDMLGSVEKVGLKTTRLRSLSGEQLVFSNTDLLGSRIRNFGRMFERRVVFSIGVTYDTPRDKLQLIPRIVREAVEAEDGTRFDRSHFSKYADYSLNFESVYYVLSADYNAYMDVQQSIYFAIHRRFEEEGIEFAYPTQTLHVVRPDGDGGSRD
ncbi:MAG: mechanosensitive ion channel family protein [Xanthomonadales bacterium]|nr:mechanosensitive ion channel family protein [Xanthomonadales bacterium]